MFLGTINSFSGKYEPFSNFARIPVVFEGLSYPTSEHAFQAAKTLDAYIRCEISSAPSPSDAKNMGRNVVLRSDWEAVKYDVMVEILRDKFSDRNPAARDLLISTGTEKLVEGNSWHDNVWGDCACPSCAGKPGTNLLGKALMQVRDELLDAGGASVPDRPSNVEVASSYFEDELWN